MSRIPSPSSNRQPKKMPQALVEDVEQQFQIGLKPVKKPEQPQETQDVQEKLTIKRKPKQSVEEKLPHRWKRSFRHLNRKRLWFK